MSEVDQLFNHMLGVGPGSNQSGASGELGGAWNQINELNGCGLRKGGAYSPGARSKRTFSGSGIRKGQDHGQHSMYIALGGPKPQFPLQETSVCKFTF